jgi:hypothetical protein
MILNTLRIGMLSVYLAGIVPAIAQNTVKEQPKLEFVLQELVTLGPAVHPGQIKAIC